VWRVPPAAAGFHRRRALSLTLLLDLDNTLLVNNMDTFVPAYLGAWSRLVANFVDPKRFVDALLGGTRQMTRNRRPDATLQEVFEAFFFPALQVDVAQFREIAERFYAQVFPTLRGLTKPRPEAVALVEQALARGYRLAIATNPLFPLTAIQQRLAWAGLPVESFSFAMVPSYERFHFTKPEPAYFAEMLGFLGWPDGPVVMVGDDLELDIHPARKAGIPAFWLAHPGSEGAGSIAGPDGPTMTGSLEDILPWLEKTPAEDLTPDYNSPAAMLATLRANPAVLNSLCRQIPAATWVRRPLPGEWCLTEVVCHLRDVDQEVNTPRLQKLLAENNPFIPGMDTDRWAEERNYIQQDGPQALAQFIVQRSKLLETLDALQKGDWQRTARHAIFGPTPLIELVGIIARHDRMHLRQVQEIIQAVA
jgi:FMN phosphatase YigB (HAD superfamily)